MNMPSASGAHVECMSSMRLGLQWTAQDAQFPNSSHLLEALKSLEAHLPGEILVRFHLLNSHLRQIVLARGRSQP